MINEALRLLRVFNDMKSYELAQKLGISPSYLSEIETGKKEPSLEIINKYAEVFNMPPSSILFFSEKLESKNHSVKEMLSVKIINFLKEIENASN